MEHNKINFMVLQETHIGDEIKESFKRSKFTRFLSGGAPEQKGEQCHHGVGIIVRNEFRNFITDVETINERFMTVTVNGKFPVTFVAAYAPTAIATAEEKDDFYDKFTEITKRYKRKGIMYIGSDMNAKLQHGGDIEEEGYGPHIFGEGHPVTEGQGVEDNRFRLQDYLIKCKTVLANTLFPKRPERLITYRIDKTAGTAPPYVKGRFDTIDYIITHRKRKNTITNIHSDIGSGIDSDHYPLLATVTISLKANYRQHTPKPKYYQCTEAQQKQLNTYLSDTKPFGKTNEAVTIWLRNAAEAVMAKQTPIVSRPFEFSQETEEALKERKDKIQHGATDEELKPIKNNITKLIRKDRRAYQASLVSKDMDLRDQFLGLRALRRTYTPIPLSMKTKEGKHIPFHKRAQSAAEFLANIVWGDHELSEAAPAPTQTEAFVLISLGMNLGDITLAELVWAIRKLKRNKTAGPDGLPVEIYKELTEEQLALFLVLINSWWNGQKLTTDITNAQVTLIYKRVTRQILTITALSRY